MGRYNLLITDKDIHYLNNIVNYISMEFNDVFTVVSFSEKDMLIDYIKEESNIDIILACEEFSSYVKEVIDEIPLILLSSDNKYVEGINYIKKYQSAEKICNSIVDIYNQKIKKDNEISTRLVAMYSPSGGGGTSTISMALARRLSELGNKVLYITLEEIQSTGIFTQNISNTYNFSDIILSIKDRDNNFKEIIEKSAIQYKDTSLYIFKNVDSVLDIEELTVDDIKDIVDNIKKIEMYDYVVFDLPSGLKTKYYYIFEMAIKVFVLMKNNVISSYKVDEMLKQLDSIDNFNFIFNMYDKSKERIIPKLVGKNLLPVITSIEYIKELEEINEIEETLKINDSFIEAIDKIIQEI